MEPSLQAGYPACSTTSAPNRADNRQPGKIGTLRTDAGSSRRMPTIYFDILSDADTIIDDEGVELPDTFLRVAAAVVIEKP